MKEPTIRPLREGEAGVYINWALANQEKSNFDPDMAKYPATSVLVADTGEAYPSLMMPIHPVYVMDSLAPNPEATPAQIVRALRKMTEIVKWEGRKMGHGEVWFVASEPSVAAYAEKHERFKEIKRRVFALKIDEE